MCFLRMFGSSLFFGGTAIFCTVTSPYFQPPPLEYPFLAQMALLRAGLLVVLFVVAAAAREGCEVEEPGRGSSTAGSLRQEKPPFQFGWVVSLRVDPLFFT